MSEHMYMKGRHWIEYQHCNAVFALLFTKHFYIALNKQKIPIKDDKMFPSSILS